MEAITVEKLYELCDVIDAAEKKNECKNEFDMILSATKSGPNEKRLAAQLLARYFTNLGDLRDKALDAMFELCEDEDGNIRKLVIKELPGLCREPGDHVTKIGDILIQLLQADEHQEQQIVHSSLFNLLQSHTKDILSAIFGYILNVEEELIRERAVKFLACKLKILPDTVMTKQMEEFVLNESKKVLQDVSGDEFIFFMHILSNLKHLQTVAGRQILLDIVIEQADLEKPFTPDDPDRIDQLIQCMKQAIPFLSKNVHSTKFVSYVLDHVFPVLDALSAAVNQSSAAAADHVTPVQQSQSTADKNEEAGQQTKMASDSTENDQNGMPKEGATVAGENNNNSSSSTGGAGNVENYRLEILRLTADLSQFLGGQNDLQEPFQKIQRVFDHLLTLLPTPPSEANSADPAGQEGTMSEKDVTSDQPKIQFSEIECTIWILHNLTKKYANFFTENLNSNSEQFKEFRKRLQYLARIIQIYSKKLKQTLSGKSKEEMKNEKNRIKLIGLKTTLNINNAVKDFLHTPPNCKSIMSPSWRASSDHKNPASESLKRPSAYDSDSSQNFKNPRKNVEIYQPPSGKYSEKVTTFENRGGFRGSWRGRGRFNRGGGGGFRRGRW